MQAHHGRLKTASLLGDAVANTGLQLLRDAVRDGLPSDLRKASVPPLPPGAKDRLYVALATRFVFSALVDADSLGTERWDKGAGRETDFSSIKELAAIAEAACLDKSGLALERADTPLNRMRLEVLRQCLASAPLPPGVENWSRL